MASDDHAPEDILAHEGSGLARHATLTWRGLAALVLAVGVGVGIAAFHSAQTPMSGPDSAAAVSRGGAPTATSATHERPLPSSRSFTATIANLAPGSCADVYSMPMPQQDYELGTLCPGAVIQVYCTVETDQAGGTDVSRSTWDLLYFTENHKRAAYILGYFADIGTGHALPKCPE